jgi:hypothetical protein
METVRLRHGIAQTTVDSRPVGRCELAHCGSSEPGPPTEGSDIRRASFMKISPKVTALLVYTKNEEGDLIHVK